MFIIIKDKTSLLKYSLNEETDINYKGIFIYHKNNNHYISLKDNYYFSDYKKIKILKLHKYEVICENNYYRIEIFVYEDNKGIDDYDVYVRNNFIMAHSKKADIILLDKYLTDRYLIFKDGYLSSNHEIILNGRKYRNTLIETEDVVEFNGIRIIFYDDFLYINHFNCHININRYVAEQSIIQYNTAKIQPHYFIPEKINELSIEQLKPFVYKTDSYNRDFLRNLLPNIIMAISISSIALLNFYNAALSNQSYLSRIIFLIMPVSMILSNVALPSFFYLFDVRKNKRNYQTKKDKYLNYLDNYNKKLMNNLAVYKKEMNSSFFNLNEAKTKMFYANTNSIHYLSLSLGKQVIAFDFEYESCEDDDINNRLEKISQKLRFVDDIPFYYDISSNRKTTIVSKTSEKDYYFNKVLTEMCYKHHYDDIVIAIYSRERIMFDDICNLPHLSYNNKRLLFNSVKQLEQLDHIKCDKPLILLMLDRYDHDFLNTNIYTIYFSKDLHDVLKNSDAIIEFNNYNGCIYKKGIKQFSSYQQDIDFGSYYNYLSRLKIKDEKTEFSFFNVFSNFDIRKSYTTKHNDLVAAFAYRDDELLHFDLHESKHGPHGLIAGSTGSGKSELIISMLLSLCIRYSPEYLNIIVIDYKGGGIIESLSESGRVVNHIIASISNLENNALERLIIALKNECLKRQELFRQLSNIINKSIMSIDDYLDSDLILYDFEKIAHLLIVVDEFAQLKKENPEQIKELISISRIGRSLGIHLILATQRPTGNIDDEIWTNSRFKISLKVFEEKDSLDVIKSKDAAYLQNPGDFLLRVDENITAYKSIYAKADINGNDPYRICLLDETLDILKSKSVQYVDTVSQASYYVRKINEISESLDIRINKFEYLPSSAAKRKDIDLPGYYILGFKDDYIHNDKSILSYKIGSNILIYSNQKKMINSLLNTLDENKKQYIVITDKSYPCECIGYDSDLDIDYLFDMLSNNDIDVVVVIEDLAVFLSYHDDYLDRLVKLIKRSSSFRYSFICFTSSCQLSYRIINNFTNRIMIGISDRSDLSYFYSVNSEYKGNSYYYDEKPVTFIPVEMEEYLNENSISNNLIVQIPERIQSEYSDNRYLLGYDIKSRQKVFTDKIIDVYSFDEKLLERYSDCYGFNTILYDHKKINKNMNELLWLGPGISMQRMFILPVNYDLEDNEAVYIKGNRKTILRSIDDE